MIATRLATRILGFDEESGRLRAEAGLSLSELNRVFMPRGWFSPVTPGTKFVTLGGMVASDVHGKNHHVEGCFGAHVERLRVRTADDVIVDCSPTLHPTLFHGCVGGMGLLGHILEIELRLRRIPSAWIWSESRRVANIDEFLVELEHAARQWPMTMGWIDCLTRGSSLGRGILMAGRWAEPGEAPPSAPASGRTWRLPVELPNAALNPWSARMFNALYYAHHPKEPIARLTSPEEFFYPLDSILHWNRAYGPRGFTQYQCVLPSSAGRAAVREFMSLLTQLGAASPLCVIKDCGPEGNGVLSFPLEGTSIAVDMAASPELQGIIDRLNEFVIAAKGRIYLSKDQFTRAEHYPGTQDLGRKFKIAFSGCADTACGLTGFHDVGCIARTREVGGSIERGFAVYVGGGLGPVPHAAELLDDFVPVEELMSLTLAVCRVFAKHGERENRSRARMKFVLMKAGLEQFKAWVDEERATIEPDVRWSGMARELEQPVDGPLRPPGPALDVSAASAAFLRQNVSAQRQPGYSTVTIKLPLGDLTPTQGRAIADLARRYTGDTLRTTVEQNLVLRWVSNRDLPEIHAELQRLGLHEAGAGGITDVTSCPGTDTCKLGISSSRGLAKELRRTLQVYEQELPAPVRGIHIKCSGCFNSCGQHHVADIGFLGVSRNVSGRRVPHFQLVVGGSWENNGSEFGLAIGAVPSKNVPRVVKVLTEAYSRERQDQESFKDWARRLGRRHVKALIGSLSEVPSIQDAPELYRDWGDPRVFSIGDIGVGECAGEVISPSQFAFAESERSIFEAQIALDDGSAELSAARALAAMVDAARAVCLSFEPSLREGVEIVGPAFDRLVGENGAFDAASPGGRFSRHFASARAAAPNGVSLAQARKRVEEARLFIDAAHAYDAAKNQHGALHGSGNART